MKLQAFLFGLIQAFPGRLHLLLCLLQLLFAHVLQRGLQEVHGVTFDGGELLHQSGDLLLSFGELLHFLLLAAAVVQRDVLVELRQLGHLLGFGLRGRHDVLLVLGATQRLLQDGGALFVDTFLLLGMRQRQLHRGLSLLAVTHVEQLADGLLFEEGGGEVPSFDGHISQHPLLVGFLQDVLFHRALADQSVDVDVPGLPDAVAAVLSLGVHGGIPVAVVKHHGVGAGQIDADAAAASRQDEAEDASVCVESLHEGLSLLHPRAAVQPEVDVSVVVEELLQNVQHPSHLSEDQHPVAAALQLPQQGVESLKLPTVVLDQTQVGELGPHVALDPVEAAGQRRRPCGQHGGEDGLLVAQRRRRVAAVHGDGRGFHRGDGKGEAVDDVSQQLQPFLHAVDGRSDGAALLPEVKLVLCL